MDMPTTKYCPNCFQPINRHDSICTYCEYDQFGKTYSLALEDNMVLHERYLLGRVLGSGGFGITYKALDLKTNNVCAIKEFVPLGLVKREGDRHTLVLCEKDEEWQFNHGKKRFLEEAEVLQKLSYIDAVAKVYDYFSENNTSYFVMEFIDGITLNRYRLKNDGKLTYEKTAEILMKVCQCLQQVHEKGNIFHRDISPENILIMDDGRVRLIDFGSAKMISSMENQTLSVVLKPGFAPPEQYSSTSKQGAYTDIYALASTFYLCMTGQKVPAALGRLVGDGLKPLEAYLGIRYHGLSEIFQKALILKSDERTQTIREFRRELEAFNASLGIVIHPTLEEEENPGPTLSYQEPSHSSPQQQVYPPPQQAPYPTPQQPVYQTPPKPVQPRKTGCLDGYAGPVAGKRYRLPANQTITVGRSSDCDICIQGIPVISKHHFDLFYSPEESLFYLEDRSRNGTYINEYKCEPGQYYWLESGATISLAGNACIFQVVELGNEPEVQKIQDDLDETIPLW